MTLEEIEWDKIADYLRRHGIPVKPDATLGDLKLFCKVLNVKVPGVKND